MAGPFSKQHESSGLETTFGSAGKVGNEGERLYANALQNFAGSISRAYGTPDRYLVAHSLNVPRKPSEKASFERVDVDGAVANGNTLVLIDVKKFLPRAVYVSVGIPNFMIGLLDAVSYRLLGDGLPPRVRKRYAFRVPLPDQRNVHGGLWVPRPEPYDSEHWAVSSNMPRAVERYRSNLPHEIRVTAITVFVGVKHPALVWLMRWGSGIRSYTPESSFERLHLLLGRPTSVRPEITALLASMKRH